jgi:glycosyltransferase involved in cell wall biosynthesis
MAVHIFVPRWMNPSVTNAQNSNARALLSRFSDKRARWTAVGNETPPETITRNGVEIVELPRSRFWQHQLALAYQYRFDAIFYPGVEWPDEFGIKLRRLSGRHTPIIATMEGVIADDEGLARLRDLVGHPVFSQPGVEHAIPRIRWLYQTADHIIAISPFLQRAARFLYGEKVSYLPLGVDLDVFHSAGRQNPDRCRVVGCGTVKNSKNPQIFLDLAARFQEADFVWYGGGPMVELLNLKALEIGLRNLRFAGSLPPKSLAEEFRMSSLFVLPSHSEGVPKVTYEAAACGLPVVLNGFFEAPTVIHQRNGLVAWSDDELSEHVGVLIRDREARKRMGEQGAQMAREWDWNKVAPRWEELVIRLATTEAGS